MPVIVNAAHILVLSQFTGKNRNDCLAGIRVEPATPLPGACLVATDGHVAAIIYDAAATIDEAATFKPSAELLKACRKVKNGGTVHIEAGIASVRTDRNGLTAFSQPEPATADSQFPNWRAFIRREPDPAVSVNELPLNIQKLSLFAVNVGGAMRLHACSTTGPIYVRLKHWPHFVGVIMPVPATDMTTAGGDLTTSSKPSWLTSMLTSTEI